MFTNDSVPSNVYEWLLFFRSPWMTSLFSSSHEWLQTLRWLWMSPNLFVLKLSHLGKIWSLWTEIVAWEIVHGPYYLLFRIDEKLWPIRGTSSWICCHLKKAIIYVFLVKFNRNSNQTQRYFPPSPILIQVNQNYDVTNRTPNSNKI